ncbi:ABC transporter family substrate-binding protein [Streptomyces sp. NBC_00083]|uniref:ABC transporter family substrate-binding protein n=1 Tax=Streptomyces sp. NBC_00083 TaxID=2975647 RepID=UPI002254F52D|nr:ABC transporter family substrate-binding protein [Streptomyces sp. NBC_00083]MCX5386668.1 ABC transporter family substrate-binding protein [Streptomyces sp. NBC_00083]
MRRTRKWAALGAAATLLLAGCTASPARHDGSARARPAPSYGTEDIDRRSPDTLRRGGTLTLATSQWVTQYNVNQAAGSLSEASEIDSLVEPELFNRDAKGVPHPNPAYLQSASVTTASPQTVTYRLNPRAHWSDGKPLSVADFEAQWQALGRGDDRYLVADPSGYDQISQVRQGRDASEVQVVFRSPYADWQRLFDPLFPASATSTPDQFNNAWLGRIPVTAGPFTIASMDPTTQSVTAVPDPAWWGTRARLDKVVFRTLLPAAALQAYLNGELDAVNAATAEAYQQLKPAHDSTVRTGSAWDEVHVSLNGAGGPLQDVDVRHAVQRAVDREALAKVAAEGLPIGVPLLGNHIFMTNQPGYADNSGELGIFDPKAAERLLDRAGWKPAGSGKPRVKAGRPLKLRFVIAESTNRLGLDLAQLLQQMLAQVGIGVEIQKVPASDYSPKYLDVGNFDLAIFRFTDMAYPSQLQAVYRLPHGAQSYLNYGRISDATLDGLLGEASATLDRGRAAQLYNEADAEIWKLGHDVELYQRPQMMAVRKGLANFGVPGLGDIDFAAVGWEK